MAEKLAMVALFIVIGSASAATDPSYLYPVEHRSDADLKSLQSIEALLPKGAYKYEIVPKDEYALEYSNQIRPVQQTELSLLSYIPSTVTVLQTVGTTAWSVTKWAAAKMPLVVLGAALVIGFCALTPHCTLTLVKPFFWRQNRALRYIPYLDEIENFFEEAYNRYHDLNTEV